MRLSDLDPETSKGPLSSSPLGRLRTETGERSAGASTTSRPPTEPKTSFRGTPTDTSEAPVRHDQPRFLFYLSCRVGIFSSRPKTQGRSDRHTGDHVWRGETRRPFYSCYYHNPLRLVSTQIHVGTCTVPNPSGVGWFESQRVNLKKEGVGVYLELGGYSPQEDAGCDSVPTLL